MKLAEQLLEKLNIEINEMVNDIYVSQEAGSPQFFVVTSMSKDGKLSFSQLDTELVVDDKNGDHIKPLKKKISGKDFKDKKVKDDDSVILSPRITVMKWDKKPARK